MSEEPPDLEQRTNVVELRPRVPVEVTLNRLEQRHETTDKSLRRLVDLVARRTEEQHEELTTLLESMDSLVANQALQGKLVQALAVQVQPHQWLAPNPEPAPVVQVQAAPTPWYQEHPFLAGMALGLAGVVAYKLGSAWANASSAATAESYERLAIQQRTENRILANALAAEQARPLNTHHDNRTIHEHDRRTVEQRHVYDQRQVHQYDQRQFHTPERVVENHHHTHSREEKVRTVPVYSERVIERQTIVQRAPKQKAALDVTVTAAPQKPLPAVVSW
jgi:hypothetical protein